MALGVYQTELLYSPGNNGMRIRCSKGSGLFELWEDQIPKNVYDKDLATIEAWINGEFAATQPEFFAVVHVYGKEPLLVYLYTGVTAPPTSNWWEPLR